MIVLSMNVHRRNFSSCELAPICIALTLTTTINVVTQKASVNNCKNIALLICDFAKAESGTCTVQQSTPRSITNHVIQHLAWGL